MSALVVDPALVPTRTSRSVVGGRRTFVGVLRGEWIKLLSLRSTWWVLAATAVVIPLISLAAAASLGDMAADPLQAQALARVSGAEIVSGGAQLGMISIAVLGALLITGEYSTGMVRSTFAAVPTRLPVLLAKAITLVVITVAITVVGLVLAWLVTAPELSRYDVAVRLDEAATWQAWGGIVYFLVAAALFSLGIGAILRSTAGTVTVALTVLLLLPGVLGFLTLDWVQTIVGYLPLPAANAFLAVGGDSLAGASELTALQGVLVIAAYGLVPLGVASVLLRRRDA